MTLEDLSHQYFKDYLNGKYTDGEFMLPSSRISMLFFDEARSKALAADDDIRYEAEALSEHINIQEMKWRGCQ